jgi:hypothetical protein
VQHSIRIGIFLRHQTGPAALAELPEFERIKWFKSWIDVDAILKGTATPK